uniref:PlxyGVORF51 protein n=1 Tax=Plutella xylostella granulovirus TaxID=98383 RepID=A0A1B2CSD5_9BBAC|nr:PlxyGVORF51 protein [Plutella xylostella granulovirus]
MAFCNILSITSQPFPQCVKYLSSYVSRYTLWCRTSGEDYIEIDFKLVVSEGFVQFKNTYIRFDIDQECTPNDLVMYAKYARLEGVHSDQDKSLIALVFKDRWFKGDRIRLRKLLNLKDYSKLLVFLENILWERSYEDNYTYGQQLSIRMTTNLIQSGLDFKHQLSEDGTRAGRGWEDQSFEKMINSIKNVADVTKRYKFQKIYVMLELDRNNLEELVVFLKNNYVTIRNANIDNVVLLSCEKSSLPVLNQLQQYIKAKYINVLLVTDNENYIHTHKIFYIYNSLKFYYYCLKNKFVFSIGDYETLYLLYTIVVLEYLNGGYLNSFTLEKSQLMHPLELNSRRCNALKRAASFSKTLNNEFELKIDFIKGKRITTGTHCASRLVDIV